MTNTMLYKHPGSHDIHGDKFDYCIVSDDDVDDALNDGWFLTTPEALPSDEAEPTRDEVKQMADELGIEYIKNIKTDKLQKLVEAKLEE